MEKKKALDQLTDQELLDLYKMAVEWTTKRMQVTNTKKNELGQPYDHQQFLMALEKIERMEDEMIKRGLTYG